MAKEQFSQFYKLWFNSTMVNPSKALGLEIPLVGLKE
jgi:hypothetical protein